MTQRPDLSDLPEGALREIGGRQMRHVGDGRFVLAEQPMFKRFGVDDEEPLHRSPFNRAA